MNYPSISVLMPAYNAEKYIAQAIESILDQTFRDFEFIIVDDTSTDKTWEIMNQYAGVDKRVHIYQNKIQLGIARSRNRLIKWSKGSYIVWQDADDVSLSYRLKEQHSFMETHPKVGIVGGYLHFFDNKDNQSIRKYAPDDKTIRSRIFYFSPVAQPAAMIRRECFKTCGYLNPAYIVASDLDMSFRIGMKYEFANIQKTIIYYRIHPSSITSRRLSNNELTTLRIRNLYQKTKPYKMNIVDKIYNLLQYLSVYPIPPPIKRGMFNLFRNKTVEKVYIPKAQFHLLKEYDKKPTRSLVSVLMPAYNAEKYIGEAIESILNQTFKDFELIIVDDASKDDTWRIIQEYLNKDKRIVAIQNKSNLKICKTLNKGVEIAKGKYIVRMDADDWSYPNRLQIQYEYMEAHKKIVISGGTMVLCDEQLNPISKRIYSINDGELRKSILKYSPFSHPTVIMRTDIVKKVGGYNLLYAEDIELYFKLGQYGKFGNLSDILIKYRDTPNSMTNTKLQTTGLHALKHRLNAIQKLNYSYNLFDIIYNIFQLLFIFFIPASLTIIIFNNLRNTPLQKNDYR